MDRCLLHYLLPENRVFHVISYRLQNGYQSSAFTRTLNANADQLIVVNISDSRSCQNKQFFNSFDGTEENFEIEEKEVGGKMNCALK